MKAYWLISAGLVIVGVLALLALAACDNKKNAAYQLKPEEHQTAELGARDYAEKLSGKFVSCSGQDSEPDGYVSCTIANDKNTPVEISCTYSNNNRGCKAK